MKLALPGLLIVAAVAASPVARSDAPDLTGTYTLIREGTPAAAIVGLMTISAQRGGFFLVGIAVPSGDPASDWAGHGALTAYGGGSYEWAFGDGKTGRTTFTRDADGTLRGHVVGSGVDWKYVARRLDPALAPARTRAALVGTYRLYKAGEKADKPSAVMTISAQRGGQFLAGVAVPTGNPALDWEGRGVIDGATGHYEWTFGDGKTGRTDVTIDREGNLLGRVRGAGLDWDYLGKRIEGPLAMPAK